MKNNENEKKYFQVSSICDYALCVRVLANSKEEAEELFLKGEYFEDDILTEEFDDIQQVYRVREEK